MIVEYKVKEEMGYFLYLELLGTIVSEGSQHKVVSITVDEVDYKSILKGIYGENTNKHKKKNSYDLNILGVSHKLKKVFGEEEE